MYFFGINLSDYSNLFGIPFVGLHALRLPFVNLATVDVVLTILGALILSRFTRYSIFNSCIILFTLAFIIHWVFCVPTALNVMILGTHYNSSKNISIP